MTTKKYYELLCVENIATTEEIKKAFKKLAIQYHPDKTGGDTEKEEKFKEIVIAYNILTDENKRKNYDIFGDGNDDLNIDEFFTQYSDFNDIFNDLFNDEDNFLGKIFTNINSFGGNGPGLVSTFSNTINSTIHNLNNQPNKYNNISSSTIFINAMGNNGFNMMDYDNEQMIDFLDNITNNTNTLSSIYRDHFYYISLKQILYGDTIIIKDTKYGKFKIRVSPGITNNYLLKKNIHNYCKNKCNNCNDCSKIIKLRITIKYDLKTFDNFTFDEHSNLYIFENISLIEYFCGFTRTYNIIDKKIGLIVNNFIDMNSTNEKYNICINNCALPIYKNNDKFTNLYVKLNIIMPKLKIFNQFKNLLSKALSINKSNINNENNDYLYIHNI